MQFRGSRRNFAFRSLPRDATHEGPHPSAHQAHAANATANGLAAFRSNSAFHHVLEAALPASRVRLFILLFSLSPKRERGKRSSSQSKKPDVTHQQPTFLHGKKLFGEYEMFIRCLATPDRFHVDAVRRARKQLQGFVTPWLFRDSGSFVEGVPAAIVEAAESKGPCPSAAAVPFRGMDRVSSTTWIRKF